MMNSTCKVLGLSSGSFYQWLWQPIKFRFQTLNCREKERPLDIVSVFQVLPSVHFKYIPKIGCVAFLCCY